MKNTLKRISVGLASSALMLNMLSPAFASTTLYTGGNGSNTENEIEVEIEQTKLVEQSNSTDISNKFDIDLGTGDNEAEDNTGGDVSIKTGDTDIIIDVENAANKNVANLSSCGTCAGETGVTISGNGTDSENEVELELETSVWAVQDNHADVDNDIEIDAETGDNDAEDNTNGDVSIKTGSIGMDIDISTLANENIAFIGGEDSDGQSISVRILDNGSNTENEVELELETVTGIEQDNHADVDNDIEIDAETGDNDAEDNTGGESSIDTGSFVAFIDVANSLNFNSANVACDDCLMDILAKVADNGTDSENEIEAELEGGVFVTQENSCGGFGGFPFFFFNHNDCMETELEIDAETGDNQVEDSTNGSDSDPMIETGDAGVDIDVTNEGGINTYGADFPEVTVDFSMGSMFAAIWAMWH